MNKSVKGFTLIELLIVVVILAILGGVVAGTINSLGVRAKARDSQRVADLNKLKTALELHFADVRQYPDSDASDNWTKVSVGLTELTAMGYMEALPVDPGQTGTATNPCGNTTNYDYYYISLDTNSNGFNDGYVLSTVLEIDPRPNSQTFGPCSSLTQWSEVGTCAVTNLCYGLQNP